MHVNNGFAKARQCYVPTYIALSSWFLSHAQKCAVDINECFDLLQFEHTSALRVQSYYLSCSSQGMGRDSSVGIATGYGLDGPGIESRWEARFFAQVQTGPEAHPASCTMGTGSFPGVKRPGRGAYHPPPCSAEIRKE
jgi:hypothetical protein